MRERESQRGNEITRAMEREKESEAEYRMTREGRRNHGREIGKKM